MKPSLGDLIGMISGPNRGRCLTLLNSNLERMKTAPGSSHNHQAWPGGYLGHVVETMQIGCALYPTMSLHHPLPFSLSDVLLVLFLHDIEKPWRSTPEERAAMSDKAARATFRNWLIRKYGFVLTPEQENALRYVEGENDDYSPFRRVMNELAAFCHCCDIASARIWYDWPKETA